MILAIDIGNTNLVLGAFEEDKLKFVARISSDTNRTEDEMAALSSLYLKTTAHTALTSQAQSYLPWFHLYSNQFKSNKAADGEYPLWLNQELEQVSISLLTTCTTGQRPACGFRSSSQSVPKACYYCGYGHCYNLQCG